MRLASESIFASTLDQSTLSTCVPFVFEAVGGEVPEGDVEGGEILFLNLPRVFPRVGACAGAGTFSIFFPCFPPFFDFFVNESLSVR